MAARGDRPWQAIGMAAAGSVRCRRRSGVNGGCPDSRLDPVAPMLEGLTAGIDSAQPGPAHAARDAVIEAGLVGNDETMAGGVMVTIVADAAVGCRKSSLRGVRNHPNRGCPGFRPARSSCVGSARKGDYDPCFGASSAKCSIPCSLKPGAERSPPPETPRPASGRVLVFGSGLREPGALGKVTTTPNFRRPISEPLCSRKNLSYWNTPCV